LKTNLVLILLFLSFSSNGQDLKKIRKVRFNGNITLSTSKLNSELNLKSASALGEWLFKNQADYYTKSLYKQDLDRIRHLYQKEGFLNISFDEPTIKVTRRNNLKLTFNINEGKPIKIEELTYTVDSMITYEEFLSKKLRRKIKLRSQLKVHGRFRDEWFYNDQVFINEEMNNMGYAYAQVKHSMTVDTLRNKVKLNWIIKKEKPTFFGPITVQGNERVPTKKVMKQLQFKEGDPWSKLKIDETQKQIYNLGMFRVASIKTLLSKDKPDTLSTLITLKEAPRWTTRFGVGYGREDDFRAFADIQTLGFLTKTGRLNLYAKHSGLEPYNFQLKLTQPAVLLPFNSFMINPFVLKQNEPAYRVKRHGLNLTFLQHLTDRFNSSINLYVEEVRSDSIIVSNLALASPNSNAPSSYSKSGVSLGFIFFNGEPRLDPVTGFSLAINMKRNGTFIERSIPFWRSLIEYKKYIGIKPGITLALKGKIGLAKMQDSNELIPIEERFYAGGSYSVRGWGRSQLGPQDVNGQPTGGNSLMEGSIENRYTIGSKLVLAVFCDAGNVWQESLSYKINDLHYAAGVGIRVKTAIGPIGVDFARPIFETRSQWQIHFNIGHPF